MANETDDPDKAADRLEAALERIARLAAQPRPALEPTPSAAAPSDDMDAQEALDVAPTTAEIAERLDDLIDRLRTVLGK